MCIQRIYLPIGWRVYLPLVKFVSCLVFSWQGQTTVFICLTGERQIIPDYPGRSTSPTRLRITSPPLRRHWVLSAAPCWLGPKSRQLQRFTHFLTYKFWECPRRVFPPFYQKVFFKLTSLLLNINKRSQKFSPFLLLYWFVVNEVAWSPNDEGLKRVKKKKKKH